MRAMRDGHNHTTFLGLWELQAGNTVTILGAYKHVIPRASPTSEAVDRASRVVLCQRCQCHAILCEWRGWSHDDFAERGPRLLGACASPCEPPLCDLAFRDAMDSSLIMPGPCLPLESQCPTRVNKCLSLILFLARACYTDVISQNHCENQADVGPKGSRKPRRGIG